MCFNNNFNIIEIESKGHTFKLELLKATVDLGGMRGFYSKNKMYYCQKSSDKILLPYTV